jgi:hypothetical protein
MGYEGKGQKGEGEDGKGRTRKWNMVKNLPGGMSIWSPNQLSSSAKHHANDIKRGK